MQQQQPLALTVASCKLSLARASGQAVTTPPPHQWNSWLLAKHSILTLTRLSRLIICKREKGEVHSGDMRRNRCDEFAKARVHSLALEQNASIRRTSHRSMKRESCQPAKAPEISATIR